MSISKFAKVSYRYDAKCNDELSIQVGEIIRVTRMIDGGWWEGTADKKTGWFPSNYVALIDPQTPVGQVAPLADLDCDLQSYTEVEKRFVRQLNIASQEVDDFHTNSPPLESLIAELRAAVGVFHSLRECLSSSKYLNSKRLHLVVNSLVMASIQSLTRAQLVLYSDLVEEDKTHVKTFRNTLLELIDTCDAYCNRIVEHQRGDQQLCACIARKFAALHSQRRNIMQFSKSASQVMDASVRGRVSPKPKFADINTTTPRNVFNVTCQRMLLDQCNSIHFVVYPQTVLLIKLVTLTNADATNNEPPNTTTTAATTSTAACLIDEFAIDIYLVLVKVAEQHITLHAKSKDTVTSLYTPEKFTFCDCATRNAFVDGVNAMSCTVKNTCKCDSMATITTGGNSVASPIDDNVDAHTIPRLRKGLPPVPPVSPLMSLRPTPPQRSTFTVTDKSSSPKSSGAAGSKKKRFQLGGSNRSSKIFEKPVTAPPLEMPAAAVAEISDYDLQILKVVDAYCFSAKTTKHQPVGKSADRISSCSSQSEDNN